MRSDEPPLPSLPLGAIFKFAIATFVGSAWALFVLRPPLPGHPGVDESWRIGLTLATKANLEFGRDVVFTYGPLGYVLQGIPDRALAQPALFWSAFIVLVALVGIWTALRGRAPLLIKASFVLGVILVSALESLDFVALAGVLALLVRAGRAPRAAPMAGVIVGLVGCFGLLARFTMGLDIIAVATAVWLTQAIQGPRRRRVAAVQAGAAAAAVAVLGLYAWFHFDGGAVRAYLANAAEISSGYSSAMAQSGPKIDMVMAFLLGGSILAVGALAARERKPELLVVSAVLLFLSWKHGFVRQDEHVLNYFAGAAVLGPLLGLAVRRPRTVRLTGVVAVFAVAVYAWWAYREIPQALPALGSPDRISAGADWVFSPLETARAGEETTAAALGADALPEPRVAALRQMRTDVVPLDLSLILANGLPWSPLPVFQAYSAYTPALDRLNRAALVERGAPQILYRYIAIDTRYPFSEMPATTVELACRYRVAVPSIETASGVAFMLLARTGGCRPEEPAHPVAARLAEPIAVPAPHAASAFVRAYADLRPTALGRAAITLWRSPMVFLFVEWADGSTRRFRLVPETLRDGLIVAPIPRDQTEAATFFAARSGVRVRSIRIVAPRSIYRLASVSFSELDRVGSGAAP